MIDVRDNSYTGRSPCHDCQRHLDGLDKNDCVRNCRLLAAYRAGESWERRNNLMTIKDEKNSDEQFKLCAIEGCDKEVFCRGLSMSDYKKWRLGEIEHPTIGKFSPVNHYPRIKPKKKKIETELAPETPLEEKLKAANDSLLRSMTDKITKEVMAEITAEHIAPYLPQEGITLCLDNYPRIKKAVYGSAEKYFLTPEHVIISLLGKALASREGAKAQK